MKPDLEKSPLPATGPVFSPFPGLVGFAGPEEQNEPAAHAGHLDILALSVLLLCLVGLYLVV